MKIKFQQLTETDYDLNKYNDLYGFLSPDAISNGLRTMDICHSQQLTSKEQLLWIITPQKIAQAGVNLYNKCLELNKETTLEYCINHQYTLAICRAFNGYQREVDLFNIFKEKGLSIKMANNQLDLQYAIDMVIKKDNILIGIQLKPISYYHTEDPHKTSIKQKNRKKNNNFIKEMNSKGYTTRTYIVYHKNNNFVINTPDFIIEQIEELRNLVS
jgi:hypothetical protein